MSDLPTDLKAAFARERRRFALAMATTFVQSGLVAIGIVFHDTLPWGSVGTLTLTVLTLSATVLALIVLFRR